MLPKGWRHAKLDSIAQIGAGGTPSRAMPERYYLNGTIPWVKSGELRETEITATEEFVTTAALAETNIKLIPTGAILLAMYGATVGRLGILGVRATTNQAVCHIVPSENSADIRYLYYALALQVPEIIKLSAGGAQPNISQGIVKSLLVMLPTLCEQRRIAQILCTWDNAIANTERLLANSRTQWQALIGVTLHLPSANPDTTAPSDNGGFPASVQPGIPTLPPAPAGWRRIRLGDHLSEVRRPVVLVDYHTYTLVTVKRSRGGVQLREVLRGLEVKTPSQFYVHADDFLISKRQIVHGACGIVPQELNGAVVSNEYAVLNTDGEIDLQFLRYLSETRYFQQTCFHSSIGVHVEKMIFKTERWLSWPFNIPSLAQQQRIVEILDTASREVESIQRQVNALKQEKTALMAQLLTGKRRVRLPTDDGVSP